MHASPPPIQGGSRMRERARTDLCGGRREIGVPTATMWPNTPLVRSNHGCSTVDSCEHCNLKRRFPSTIYPATVESELVTRSRITFLSCRRSISNCEILKKPLIEMRFDGSTLTMKTGRFTCLALMGIVLT